MARKSNERPRLVARIPAIAMFGSSNIPEWFLADTSPNEYAILQRLRLSEEQQQQDRAAAATARKEEDDGESSTVPAMARSAYPLAVAASGRGDRRRRFCWIGSNRRSLVTNVVVGLVALLGLALLLLFRAHPETAAGWMRSSATAPPAPAPRQRWLTSIQPWNNDKNVPQDHTTPSWSRRGAGARKPDEDVIKVKPVSQQAAARVVVVKTTTAAAPKTKEVAAVAVPGLLPPPTRSVTWNWTLGVEEKEQEAVPAEPRVRLSPLPEQTDLLVGRVQQLAQQLLKNGSKQKKPAFLGRVQQLAQQLRKNGSTLEVEEEEQEAAVPAEPRVLLSPLPEQTDLFVGRVQQLAQQLLKHGSKKKNPAFFGRFQQLAQQLLKNGSKTKPPATATTVPPIIRTALALF